MAVETITKSSDGYTLTGSTNVGRPVSISVHLDGSRKADVSIEPSPGAPTEEPLVERELANIIAEHNRISARIQTIFEMMPDDVSDETLLASIAGTVSKEKVSPDTISDLIIDNKPSMSM